MLESRSEEGDTRTVGGSRVAAVSGEEGEHLGRSEIASVRPAERLGDSRRRGLSIGAKLALAIAGLQLLIVGGLTWTFQSRQVGSLQANLRTKAETYGQLAAQQVRSAVAFDDQETAREVFESIAKDRDLSGVTLFKQDGNVLYSWGALTPTGRKAAAGVDESHAFELPSRVLVVAPVVSLEGPRGTLALELSKDEVVRSGVATRNTALATGGAALSLGLLVAWLIAQSLARRLRVISSVASAVAAGDLEQEPIQDGSSDEIGTLARGFNTMLRQLQGLISEIRRRAEEEQTRLEALVTARTVELSQRNEDMRRVLENVDQGFLTVDLEGRMSKERSAIVERWLGPPPESELLWEYIERVCPGVLAQFEVCWQEVIEGVMPLELTLDQMPRRFESGDQHFSIEYRPVLGSAGQLERVLVVLSDVTAILERERVEQEEQEITKLFARVLEDRMGVLEFFAESNDLVEAISVAREDESALVKRLVHTLKGNAGLFGLGTIAGLCHEIEEAMEESRQSISAEDAKRLVGRWHRVSSKLGRIVGEQTDEVTIKDDDYQSILQAIGDGLPRDQIRDMVEAWKLEAMDARLDRIAEQAQGLAKRLGKYPVDVRIEANKVRLDPSFWAPIWSNFPHLLRNAVDHGLETPEERAARGKEGRATLTLRTRLTDGEFCIDVEDDGRGICWDAVRSKAKDRGMSAGTHDDLVRALFQDGLSTRGDANEISGRGIGMGSMKAAVESLGGRVRVESEVGRGTRVRLAWPAEVVARPRPGSNGPERPSLVVGLKWAKA